MSEQAHRTIEMLDDAAHRESGAVLSLVGHNNPPEPTPFDLSREEIEGLYMEAVNWLDGSGVKTQDDADAVSKLMDMLRQAIKRADKHRSSENRAFDEGKAEVQARYAPLIADNKTQQGKAVQALDVCKKALSPFLQSKEAEKQAKAEAARAEADRQAALAREAMAASDALNLAARAKAEQAVHDAKAAEKIACRAENDKARATGGSRTVGLRKRWTACLGDRREAARFMWQECPEQFDALLTRLGQDFVDAGRRALPGFIISESVTVQ